LKKLYTLLKDKVKKQKSKVKNNFEIHQELIMAFKRLIYLIIILLPSSIHAQGKPLTLEDVMKFRQIKNPVISDSGKWVGFTSMPDRGNPDAVIQSISNNNDFKIERGEKIVFSTDEKWAAVSILPDFAELEKKEKDKDKPKNGLKILNLENEDTLAYQNVKGFTFSEDSKWIVINFYEEEIPDSIKKNESNKKNNKTGTPISILNLDDRNETKILFVTGYAFDSLSNYLAYSITDTSGKINGIYLRELKSDLQPERMIDTAYKAYYTSLEWNKNNRLAFVKALLDEKNKTGPADIYLWDGSTKEIITSDEAPEGWMIPSTNKLRWSKDGERLFFGYKPKDDDKNEKDTTEADIFNFEKILEKRELDVWHWNDPLIKSHEKKRWKDVKDQTYQAVYHSDKNKTVQLADLQMPYINNTESENFALGYSDVLYLKEITWDGWYYDFYIVDINSGESRKITERIESYAQLSPYGSFAVYYKNLHWHLYDVEKDKSVSLTEKIKTPFYNEDNDVPAEPRPYGIAGWTEDDKAVLVYDKYDIWKFNTDNYEAVNMTGGIGRENEYTFRIVKTDPKAEFFKEDETLLLSAYHDRKKHKAFYKVQLNRQGVEELLEEEMRFEFISKVKNSDKILFTKETYSIYPDLWISDINLNNPENLTDFNSQTNGFAWGEAELVEWESPDGIPLQGVLIKPGNYEQRERYPVIVYFYELFSHRLYSFNDMVVNHRPNFPFYASNGYAIFLPDVKYEAGKPGQSAVNCLESGVEKLIEIGIADPDAIGLHGHSWSGYQTAFVVTQTDIFKCAIAGAPVSNMTSAYSGIRWGTGLARQWQYEKQQSRIGGSLWDSFQKYFDNSPVFFADKINTPLLIQHGDEDEAVPWYQSIELYLAMRRLNKDCIFLHYIGEPHHLKKYGNKLDYSIKMKEYFDHYLKGEPAAEWIEDGEVYKE
jgi:dipeptidyl aminopeptidase/acylaminoacyl peptidase